MISRMRTDIVNQGREALQQNFASKQIAYARAMLDHGDHSTDCRANTTGNDRHERMFFYISAFPPTCDDPTSFNCDTVDLIQVSHDNGQMFNSPAGLARLFTDNFYGNHGRAYDFGSRVIKPDVDARGAKHYGLVSYVERPSSLGPSRRA